ncbi:MAG: hypothetical protein HZY76_04010 [Anaerolineae bacterium]|nr:MAG: hypothetical protein HZY76_04010 [Anaerolineae bacterium]
MYLLVVYPTASRRRPQLATLFTLGLTALAVVVAAAVAPTHAPALLAFLLPLPVAAAVTVGSRLAMLWAAGIATAGAVVTVFLGTNSGQVAGPPRCWPGRVWSSRRSGFRPWPCSA